MRKVFRWTFNIYYFYRTFGTVFMMRGPRSWSGYLHLPPISDPVCNISTYRRSLYPVSYSLYGRDTAHQTDGCVYRPWIRDSRSYRLEPIPRRRIFISSGHMTTAGPLLAEWLSTYGRRIEPDGFPFLSFHSVDRFFRNYLACTRRRMSVWLF